MNSFTFDGVSSETYGVIVSGTQTFVSPERDVEYIEVPGRNGTLLLDNGRWHDVDIVYPCLLLNDFKTDFPAFRAWLMSKVGKFVLTDTYDTTHFRRASFRGGFEPETAIRMTAGKFEVVFRSQPQLFLNSGNSYQTIGSSGSTITNPTNFVSLPVIRVTFSSATRNGTVTVGGKTITITGAGASPLYIDCEGQNATYLSGGNIAVNQNSKISLTSGEFPSLPVGNSVVSWTGNISSVAILPRWWTL